MLLYDGDCGVCGWTVRTILRHDRAGRIRFAALDSAIGRQLLAEHGVSKEVDSLVLVDGGRARIRSDAVLGVLRRLGGAWHLLRIGGIVPRGWRDRLYDAVARRRQRWSARRGLACIIPTPAERARFLDAAE